MESKLHKYNLDINGIIQKKLDERFLRESIQKMLISDPESDNFLVLERESPIENSIYLQVMYENEMFYIETRVIHEGEEFRHYLYKTLSLIETEKIFIEYYENQKLPDISIWRDITNNF